VTRHIPHVLLAGRPSQIACAVVAAVIINVIDLITVHGVLVWDEQFRHDAMDFRGFMRAVLPQIDHVVTITVQIVLGENLATLATIHAARVGHEVFAFIPTRPIDLDDIHSILCIRVFQKIYAEKLGCASLQYKKTNMQKIDEAFMATEEYTSMLAATLESYPTMNESLFQMALAASFANPTAYRKAKKRGYVPPQPPTPPPSLTIDNVAVYPPGAFEPSIVQQIQCEGGAPMSDTTVSMESSISISEHDSHPSPSELPEIR
jgi:hypothetical protein